MKLVGLLYSNNLFIAPPKLNDASGNTVHTCSESHNSQFAKTPTHEPVEARQTGNEEQTHSWQGFQSKTDLIDDLYEAIDEFERRTLTMLHSPTPLDAMSRGSLDAKNQNDFLDEHSGSKEEYKEKVHPDLYAIEEVNETIIDEESRSSKMSKLGWTGRTEQAANHESPFKDKSFLKRLN